jgi:hypothetical protein
MRTAQWLEYTLRTAVHGLFNKNKLTTNKNIIVLVTKKKDFEIQPGVWKT